MALWNYCAICGKRIEAGDPCLGVEKKNAETAGDSICFDCVKIENINGLGKTVSITDLLARAEAAENRAEKAERERDAAISDLTYIARTYPVDLCDDLVCQYCKHYQNVNTGCPGWTENDCFEWRGKKEE